MPDTTQPLDHRAFLQQFILTLGSNGIQGMPFNGSHFEVVGYAQSIWEGIERAVRETAVANSTQALQKQYAVCRHLQTLERPESRDVVCVSCGAILNRPELESPTPMSKRP